MRTCIVLLAIACSAVPVRAQNVPGATGGAQMGSGLGAAVGPNSSVPAYNPRGTPPSRGVIVVPAPDPCANRRKTEDNGKIEITPPRVGDPCS